MPTSTSVASAYAVDEVGLGESLVGAFVEVVSGRDEIVDTDVASLDKARVVGAVEVSEETTTDGKFDSVKTVSIEWVVGNLGNSVSESPLVIVTYSVIMTVLA